MSDPTFDPKYVSDPSVHDQVRAADDDLQQPQRSPIMAYSELNPTQTHAAARVFITHFQQLDNPRAREYAALDPDAVLPSQLHEMHKFASEHHPDVLADILRHPALQEPVPDDFITSERARLDSAPGSEVTEQ